MPEHFRLNTQTPNGCDWPSGTKRTCKSLRLNIDAAMEGRTFELLPSGFEEYGQTYPLPSFRKELQKLIVIPIPSNVNDCGTLYLKRAVDAFRRSTARRQSQLIEMGRREQKIRKTQENYEQKVKQLRDQIHAMRDDVREKAEEAIASLTDLFTLGRKGLEAQMKAHLDGQEWQGERIDAQGFRDCTKMVLQSVARLGLPSEERKKAQEAIIEETAAALRDTKEALNLATSDTTDGEITH